MGLGAAILFAPRAMHEANNVDLGNNAGLLSEIRSPGAALIAVGVLLVTGGFLRTLTAPAAIAGAVVYLGYGLGRIVSVVMDGVPSSTLVAATAAEFVIGLALLLTLPQHRSAGGVVPESRCH